MARDEIVATKNDKLTIMSQADQNYFQNPEKTKHTQHIAGK